MLGALSRLPSWELDHREEDVRGWPLQDESGKTLGRVADLIVDTDTRYVAQVVLSDGRRFPAHDVYIGDAAVALRRQRPIDKPWADPALRVPHKAESTGEAQDTVGTPIPSVPVERKVEERSDEAERTGRLSDQRARMSEMVPTRNLIAQEGDLVIPVVNEELEVVTSTVEAGGVRIESHFEQIPAEKTVRLREERVTVERYPVERDVTSEEAEARLRDAEVELRAKAEVPVVQKRAHVVEEIVITRTTTEREETVHDTIRKTEVEVTAIPTRTHSQPRK